jgi:hypothetical protein
MSFIVHTFLVILVYIINIPVQIDSIPDVYTSHLRLWLTSVAVSVMHVFDARKLHYCNDSLSRSLKQQCSLTDLHSFYHLAFLHCLHFQLVTIERILFLVIKRVVFENPQERQLFTC